MFYLTKVFFILIKGVGGEIKRIIDLEIFKVYEFFGVIVEFGYVVCSLELN